MIGQHRERRRRGAAAAEFVLVAPIVVFLFVAAVDFCRVFHYLALVSNAARAGAIYESDPMMKAASPYTSAEQAARADCPELGGALSVLVTPVTVDRINYVDVTATYPFTSVVSYTGIPTEVILSRTTRVRVIPPNPDYL